ncbi:hypothetical protein LPJ72_002087 [Coemansia sp. Benny D160-2]|nr:hypothetical protein LPJ72_002087 [Coemansia sp. Benny D160-2]
MVGDPIFLIGKDEVRYYGLLSQVNEADRTITLEQARCLGTEGRLGNPAKEIPPSSTVFELIRFRADEVKHVEFVADSGNAAPPPPPAAAAPAPQSQPAVNSAAAGGYRPVDVSVQNQQQQHQQQQPSSYGASAAASGGDQHQPARSDGAGTYQPPGSRYQDGSERAAEGDGYQANHQQRQGSGGYGRGGYGQQNQRGGRGGYNYRGNGPRRGGYQGRGGYQQQGNRYGQQNRRMEVPESDFDFETSNSKLNKNEVAKEFAKLNVKVSDGSEEAAPAAMGTAGSAGGTWSTAAAASSSNNSGPSSGLAVADTYVPKKSFFDDISSEVKERMETQDRGLSFEERRSRMNAERQQNYETFGQTSVDPNRLRYNRYNNSRGGYQGQGGQGGGWRGGRGGRGGYNHRGNNRGNYNGGHRNQNHQNQNQQTSAGANPSGGGGLVDSGAQA